MAAHNKKNGTSTANEMSLFDMIEEINPQKFAEPDFQIETRPLALRIKDALGEAIKNSGVKRYEIAGRMSELLGAEISESMLNSYTAESKEGYRMPAEYLPTFCKVTQDYTALEILVAASGGRMVKSDEIYLLEMGRLAQIEKTVKEKRAELQREWSRSRGEKNE